MRSSPLRLLFELLRATIRVTLGRLTGRIATPAGWRVAILVEVLRRDLAPTLGHTPAETRRREQPAPLAPGLTGRLELTEGELAGLRTLEARPKSWRESRPTVLYFHGGGYCLCSARTSHRAHIAQMADRWGAKIVAPDYRLAPGSPWPAALEDALAAWRALRAPEAAEGPLVMAGDSAGGGLTLACLIRLVEEQEPLPEAAVLFSPWVDLSLESPTIDSNRGTDYLGRELLEWFARHTLAGQDAKTCGASPLFGDPRGLPPLLIQAGGAETLVGEARRFARRVEEAGGDVRLEVAEGLPHVYQVMAPLVPEALEALDAAGQWLEDRRARPL